MVEPIVWIAGGAAAFFLLKPSEKKAPKTAEEKAEEISQDVIDQVDDKILEETGEIPVEEIQEEENVVEETPSFEDVNDDGLVNVKDIVATVNNQIDNFNENQDESIGSAEAGELDDDQKVLYEQTAKQRSCIQIYEDKPIDEKTEQVYVLLESNKGWKVKFKPLQDGSTVMRKFFCPPGREPLEW